MRDVSTEVPDGNIIDNFSVPVNLSTASGKQEIVGSFELATITVGYTLISITNSIYYPSVIATLPEGECSK